MKIFIKCFAILFLTFTPLLKVFPQENDQLKQSAPYLIEDSIEKYDPISRPEYKPTFFKMLLILTALIALIFVTFYLFKRLMKVRLHQTNLTKNIKILERRPLSPKSILYLIEVDGKKTLISESSLEVRKITDLS